MNNIVIPAIKTSEITIGNVYSPVIGNEDSNAVFGGIFFNKNA